MRKIVTSALACSIACFSFAQNVGIGTTSPAAKLDVKANSAYVAQFNGTTAMYMGIFENDVYRGYWGSYSGAPEDVDFGTGAGNASGKLHFTIQADPKMTLMGNNVGIGTTTPNYRLHINGGDLFVQSSTGLIRFGYQGANEWQLATTGGGADLRWYTTTDGGTTITPRHYFSQNGNVGIGGFSGPGVPQGRLDVIGAGASSATNTFMLRNSIGDTLLRMRDDGRMGIGYNGTSYGRTINTAGTGINFYTATTTGGFGGAVFPTDTSLVMWSNSGANNYLILQPSWGNTGIGTYSPNAKMHVNGNTLIGGVSDRVATGYLLSVAGKMICTEARVQLTASWPDYVFADDYQLPSLESVEKFVQKNKHLPNIPAAAEVEAQGFDLGDMNRKLLEKIEQLTLHLIEMKKENKALNERLTALETKK
jgi:hypothetical protein